MHVKCQSENCTHGLMDIFPGKLGPCRSCFPILLTYFNLLVMASSNGSILRVTGPLSNNAEFWCFLISAPEQTTEQTFEILVIWDAMTFINVTVMLTFKWPRRGPKHAEAFWWWLLYILNPNLVTILPTDTLVLNQAIWHILLIFYPGAFFSEMADEIMQETTALWETNVYHEKYIHIYWYKYQAQVTAPDHKSSKNRMCQLGLFQTRLYSINYADYYSHWVPAWHIFR